MICLPCEVSAHPEARHPHHCHHKRRVSAYEFDLQTCPKRGRQSSSRNGVTNVETLGKETACVNIKDRNCADGEACQCVITSAKQEKTEGLYMERGCCVFARHAQHEATKPKSERLRREAPEMHQRSRLFYVVLMFPNQTIAANYSMLIEWKQKSEERRRWNEKGRKMGAI